MVQAVTLKWSLAFLLGLAGALSANPARSPWTPLPLVPLDIPALGIAATESRVLAASRDALYEFQDSLSAWQKVQTGTFGFLAAAPTFHVLREGSTTWMLDRGRDSIPRLTSYATVAAVGGDTSRVYLRYQNGEVFVSDRRTPGWRPLDSVPAQHGFTCTLVLPSVVLAGSHEGLFRSRDRGATWDPVEGLPRTFIHSVLRFGDRVYALINGQGVYHSRDMGESWSALFPPGSALARFAFEDLEAVGDTVWLVTPQAPSEGVLRSVDAGRTWAWFHEGMPGILYDDPDSDAPSIRIYPGWSLLRISDALWVYDGNLMYRSRDGGRRWTPMPSHPGNLVQVGTELKAIITDSPTDDVLTYDPGRNLWLRDTTFPQPVFRWLGSVGDTIYIEHEGSLKRRTSARGAWGTIRLPWGPGENTLGPGRIGSGMGVLGQELLLFNSVVHHSDDLGKTWRRERPFLPRVRFRGALLEGRGTVLCWPDDSTYSPPRVWREFPQPIRALWAVGDTLLVRAGHVLYTLADSAGPWREDALPDTSMALALRNGKVTGYALEAVWTHVRPGGGWNSRVAYFPRREVRALAAGPGGIWALSGSQVGFRRWDGSSGTITLDSRYSYTLRKALAAEVGSHLVLAQTNLFDTLRMDRLQDGQFYNTAYRWISQPSTVTALLGDGDVLVATFASELLQYTTDLGRTRSPERRLPETITSLAGRLDRLFALGEKALYATSDSGKTWTPLPAADPDGAPLRHLAGDASLLAALTAQGRVLVSKDSARSWSPLPELPSGLLPVAVAVHAGRVAVGTRDHGVFLWGAEESVALREIRDGKGSSVGGRTFRPGWVRSPGGWLYRTAPGKQVDLRGRIQAWPD